MKIIDISNYWKDSKIDFFNVMIMFNFLGYGIFKD